MVIADIINVTCPAMAMIIALHIAKLLYMLDEWN
jgi:hypothetical protein